MHLTPEMSTVINTLIGIIISVFTAYLTHRVKTMSDQNRAYRKEREKKEDEEAERQRVREESNDALTLGMARIMLLNNYQFCVQKGYYSTDQREVYHALYQAYRNDSGNGIIAQLAKKIVELPTEPPKED